MYLMNRDNSDLSKPIKREKKKPKPIKKVSKKQSEYETWLIKVARPAVIERDGDYCRCCLMVHYPHDLDHVDGKGHNPSRKRDITNLQLLGRFPCHRNKTDRLPCTH